MSGEHARSPFTVLTRFSTSAIHDGGRAWTSTNIRPRNCSPASASPIPRGGVAYSPEQAVYRASEIGGTRWAVKAQIHSGARGKAGGIKLCSTEDEVRQAAKALLGKRLVTHQTGPEGRVVHRLYVEAAVPIERELYLGLVLDRKSERIMVVASRAGRHGDRGDRRDVARRDPARGGGAGGRA